MMIIFMGYMQWSIFVPIQSIVTVIFMCILYLYYYLLFFLILRKSIMISLESIMSYSSGLMLYLVQVLMCTQFYSWLSDNLWVGPSCVYTAFFIGEQSDDMMTCTAEMTCLYWRFIYIGNWFERDEELGTWFGTV